jgi:hypothetical protein
MFLETDFIKRKKENGKRRSPNRKGINPGPGLWKLPRPNL